MEVYKTGCRSLSIVCNDFNRPAIDMNTEKVLIIAYVFPPSGGPGVQRTSKFVKYLPTFNWEPIVLTGRQKLQLTDDNLLNDIPLNTKIIRTINLAPPESLRQVKLWGIFYRLLGWLSVPDLGVWWAPFALWHGIKILRREPIKVIYATGGPFSALIVGVILKRLFQLPLVLDFRDPWTLNPRRLPRKWHVFWREPVEQLLELMCLKNADKVLCVSQPMVQLFATRFEDAIIQKFGVITNGFDPDDLPHHIEPGESAGCADKVNINYIGTINNYQTFDAFLKGVQILLSRRPELKTKVQCLFVGNNQPVEQAELDGIVSWSGYVSHPQAIRLMAQADILLLITGGSPHEVTGKLFEYIATGKPILALAPVDGAVAEILGQVKLGKVVSPTNPQDVAGGLEILLDDLLAGMQYKPDWQAINQYTRYNTAAQLAATFDGLAAKT